MPCPKVKAAFVGRFYAANFLEMQMKSLNIIFSVLIVLIISTNLCFAEEYNFSKVSNDQKIVQAIKLLEGSELGNKTKETIFVYV